MKIRNLSVLSLAAVVALAACGDDTEGDDDVLSQDTSVVSGMDTIQQPTAVPTQDTVIETTTVDTISGDPVVGDTVRGDTARP